MAKFIYALCALTALACAWLAFRSYFQNRHRLLFWTGLSFGGLALSNFLLLLDKTIFLTTADLLTLRLCVTLAALLALLYGLMQGEN
jgi:hypothetical protein